MLNRFIFTSFLLMILSPAQSFARSYIVEAIIFTNEGVTAGSAEQWDPASARNQNIQSKILAQHARARALRNPNSINRLAGIRQALARSPEHRILQSTSWSQSEASYASSPLVKITAQQLLGAIKIYAPNLLFAELNLRYLPDSTPGFSQTSSPSYFMNEKRRLKLNEIHYFDHPKFGVILSVRPI